MGNIRHFYNLYRKRIWSTVIIIASLIIIIQLANTYEKYKNPAVDVNTQNIEQANDVSDVNTSEDNTSNDSNSSDTSTNARREAINTFVDYCNKKDLENAYNMLTDNCKEQMFNNIETFENIYYSSTFENRVKQTSMERWANNTYKVEFMDDTLSTGKSPDDNQKTDYITTVRQEDGSYKLNVNSYIGYTEIEKTTEKNDISVEVLNKNTYMNFETYTIKVTNNNGADIKLDSFDDGRSIYIEDENGTDYPDYKNELTDSMLTIAAKHTKEITIKFYSSYITDKKINKLVFSDVWESDMQLEAIEADV